MNAIYGRDVRSSIHDAIEICYNDVTSGKTTAESAAESDIDRLAGGGVDHLYAEAVGRLGRCRTAIRLWQGESQEYDR